MINTSTNQHIDNGNDSSTSCLDVQHQSFPDLRLGAFTWSKTPRGVKAHGEIQSPWHHLLPRDGGQAPLRASWR